MKPSGRLRCMIVDDEPAARDLIKKYIQKIPNLELIAACESATDALFQIPQLSPDLLFLDIEMPELNGFELLKMLPPVRPAVIMVTGDPSYALEGYEQQITDYLMKPVSFERFMMAVGKVVQARAARQPLSQEPAHETFKTIEPAPRDTPATPPDFLLLKENKKLIKVLPNEIDLVEGMKDYLKLYWGNKISIIHMTMSRLEETLSKTLFLRVNRSYIVNKEAIQEIEGNEITTRNGKKVPIGVTYRSEVLATLQKNRI